MPSTARWWAIESTCDAARSAWFGETVSTLRRRELGWCLRAATYPSRRAEGAASWPPAISASARVAAACSLPVWLGFVLPAAWLAAMLGREAMGNLAGLPLERFALWAWSSFKLSAAAAVAATLLALAVGFAIRQQRGGRDGLFRAGVRVLSLGYAVPGAVVALGIMLPVAWVQARWPAAGVAALFTGTAAGLLFAYLVRFSAVALQSVEAGYTRLPQSVVDSAARLLASCEATRSSLVWMIKVGTLTASRL